MTTQSDALPRCPSCGHTSIGIETYVTDGFYAFCRSCHACGPYVSKEKAIAAFTNPAHALAASRAEVERLRQAAANVAAMYQTDPLTTVDGLTDTDFIMRISALRAALAAQGGDRGAV